MKYALVIWRQGGAFRFLVREYESRRAAVEAKRRIWRRYRIRFLKVIPCNGVTEHIERGHGWRKRKSA
jgi:hypothetical protein